MSGTSQIHKPLGNEGIAIMNNIINPVIMCGGSGTRLWPLSRKSYPKQFVKIKFSNFQSTTMECLGAGVPRIAVFRQLFEQAVSRGEGQSVRLLGLGVRFRDQAGQHFLQLPLFT